MEQYWAGRQHLGMALSFVPSWPQGRCEADPPSPCPSDTFACTAFSPASKILPRLWLGSSAAVQSRPVSGLVGGNLQCAMGVERVWLLFVGWDVDGAHRGVIWWH